MRLALYHPWIYLRGGAERVITELVLRSQHEWVVLTHHLGRSTFPELLDHGVVELEPRVSVRRSFGSLAAAAATIARARLPDEGARALLVSSEGLGDLVLSRSRLPAACYCHTPLKILFDPTTRASLARQSPRQSRALGAGGPLFAAVDRRLWRRYRHVFANSGEVRHRIAAARLRPGGPLEVLPPGVDTNRFRPDHRPREAVFLVLGRIMWQKNVELAIDAFALASRGGAPARLVIAGAVDAKSAGYLAMLRRRAAGLPVEFEPDLAERRVEELYRRCLALVLPSPSEDFGIVPLEAMASGAPVLAVDAGGPRETVLPGRTGWLLPPDPAAFAQLMEQIARAPQTLAPMRRQAREHALAFGWERFVGRVDEVMASIAHAPGRGGLGV